MKISLDQQEIIDLIKDAMLANGFANVEDIELDLGEGNSLPVDLIQGLTAKVSR